MKDPSIWRDKPGKRTCELARTDIWFLMIVRVILIGNDYCFRVDTDYPGIADYIGLTIYNGALFYVSNGVFDWEFNGNVFCNGNTYAVINGAAAA